MKEWFYNSYGFNTACITVQGKEKELKLYYQLYDNPIQHIWQDIHKNTKSFKTGTSTGTTLEELVILANELLKQVNLPLLSTSVTQEELNKLHNLFVQAEINEVWSKLNTTVHMIECKLKSLFPDCQATFNFYADPNDKKYPIKEEYKLFLTPDKKWGSLLLGYDTLGKDYLDIASDGDDLTDLANQEFITSETLLTFDGDYSFDHNTVCQFYKWAKKSNLNIPLNNLNELMLGRFALGNIIITDVFLDYHPIIGDWYMNNNKCRLLWNKHVLGNKPVVKSLEFFDSDLFFETAVAHTGALDCIK